MKKLSPFKWYCLENFPFLEAYIDGYDEYQLLCKLYEQINKNNEKVNAMGVHVQAITEYINNYFDNLDVQDEINNKLNDMAESGELEEIIAQYLNTQAVLGFNTVANMKSATNLINGGIVKTLGETTYNDGNGAFYKIRTLTSSDVVDEENIIALTNYPTLIAELIPYSKMKQVIQENSNPRNALYIGNSYTTGVGSTSGSNGIFNLTKDLFNNAYFKAGSGTGFLSYTDHDNDTFITQLQRAINDTNIPKDSITDIIVIGAWGDSRAYRELGYTSFKASIVAALNNFYTLVKQNFPNASRISYYWAESRANKTYNFGSYPSYFSDSFNIHNLMKYICPKCRYSISWLGWI